MWRYEFHPPIQLMLLHYLVKVEKPKMYVNTTSAFNVNYNIAVTCIKLHWQFHKMFSGKSYKWTFMSEHVLKVSMTSMHNDLRDSHASIDDVLVKVKTSLLQALSQVIDVMNICFMHTLLYIAPNKAYAVAQRVERWTCDQYRSRESYSGQRSVTTLGKLFTPMCLCHQAV